MRGNHFLVHGHKKDLPHSTCIFHLLKYVVKYFLVSAILHHISLLKLLPKSYFKISTLQPNFLCSSSFKDITHGGSLSILIGILSLCILSMLYLVEAHSRHALQQLIPFCISGNHTGNKCHSGNLSHTGNLIHTKDDTNVLVLKWHFY